MVLCLIVILKNIIYALPLPKKNPFSNLKDVRFTASTSGRGLENVEIS